MQAAQITSEHERGNSGELDLRPRSSYPATSRPGMQPVAHAKWSMTVHGDCNLPW